MTEIAQATRIFPPSLQSGRHQLVPHAAVALIVLGLVTAWVAAIEPIERSFATVDAVGKSVMQLVKTPVYYAAHGLSIAAVMLVGLITALDGKWRVIAPGARAAFYLLFTVALAWAMYSYSSEELLSAKIFGATGPFVWLTVILVLAGIDRTLWPAIDRTVRVLAYASAVLAVRTLVELRFTLYSGASRYTDYSILLLWLGGYTLLTSTRRRGWSLLPRVLPATCMAPLALCSQSRSLTLLSILLIFLFVILRARENGSIAQSVPLLAGMAAAACVVVVFLYAATPHTLEAGWNGFVNRVNEDTRTGQYADFFNVVPVSDLLLGRGPNGTWYWRGLGEYQFFDNGYLWILFIGGVPTLLCYVRIVLWPAVQACGAKPLGDDAAAVALTGIWVLCLMGFSVFTLPGVEVTNFVVLLLSGRCHAIVSERRCAILHARSRVLQKQHAYVR